ncbi:Ribulose bisphosphate carboxylase small chain 1A [Dorcoceras hygrometricum]|uniref:Ribulose bisphosphate carboxylase small chain 1A n=1 Tax=Dorcoceras hygrometricum TaxID=472368 RepID=A0A2Z7CI31_9LAMI|nr:Ribulose bisphosphate carboxylase small chain 1A [Dorcoceras hygrometricum]
MRCRIEYSDLTLGSGICLAGVNRCERLFGQVWMSVSGICCENVTPMLRHFVKVFSNLVFLIFIPDNPRLVLFIRTLFSIDCRRFTPPFGARLVALSSSYLGLSIDTSLKTGVIGIEEREVVAVFVYLRDF